MNKKYVDEIKTYLDGRYICASEASWRIFAFDIHFRNPSVERLPVHLEGQRYITFNVNENIEKLLNNIGKSLKHFPQMPFPESQYMNNLGNPLILEEMSYDVHQMSIEHSKFGRLPKNFFVENHNLSVKVGSKIVLPVASSGIAAVLLPGGRTAHSRFHLPLILDTTSTAGIKHGIEIAELLQNTSLIIWDEEPMQHRHAFEAVDSSLRDIMSTVDKKN
ncbi:uncharacterized protein LOC141718524 [Apium graveolens]|uniref:uncharacterized protein LOC141718524 n=1 Tax=Apium graveolens TaxID=4045 RepID=UPI003D792202